jgi:hypothetical protein
VYLGEHASFESSLERFSSGPIASLHIGAQRVAWGILMGDRVGVDLDVAVRELEKKHGDHFATHVAAALARRAQGREHDADKHLSRARELLEPGHPWAALLPTDADWRAAPLSPKLIEEEPGRVYRVVAENKKDGAVFGNRGTARFLRMRSGELVLVNPVAIPDAVAEEVRSLGDVTHIIAPAKYHSDYVPHARALFPKARVFGVPGHRGYPNVAHIKFDGYLSDDAPLFPGELDHVALEGVDVGDVWLVDRASKTLIVTDAVFFTRLDTPDAADYATPFGTFYTWAWGVFDRIGIPSYQPAMWNDLGRYQASLRRALALEFENVASCHGPWRSIEGRARDRLRENLGWVLELGKLGGVGLLGDFARRHPGMFFRLVKEQLAKGKTAG